MHDDRWWIWLLVAIVVLGFRGLGALLRTVKRANSGTANTGMERMNAAAERILKERAQTGGNPIPRTTPAPRHPAKPAAQPRHHPPAPKTVSTPAVIRRGGLLSGSREPVIQRRR